MTTSVRHATQSAWAYLRVSTDAQDAENQRLGIVTYANANALTIDREERDTKSGSTPWRDRAIARLIDEAIQGQLILVAEVSRLARTTLQVLEIAAAAADRGVTIHAVKNNLTFDDTLSSKITTTILALAAEIERDLIRSRTKEALALARANGATLGRPVGSRSQSKLDQHAAAIKAWQDKGLGPTSIAKLLSVSRSTLHQWLHRDSHQPSNQPTLL